jgi:intraflagellar transport protein 46
MDQGAPSYKPEAKGSPRKGNESSSKAGPAEMGKSQTIANKQYDEALEFSQSGSDDSVDTKTEKDTRAADKKPNKDKPPAQQQQQQQQQQQPVKDETLRKAESKAAPVSSGPGPASKSAPAAAASSSASTSASAAASNAQGRHPPAASNSPKRADTSKDEDDEDEEEEEEEEEDEAGESYENIEGAYHPKDYANLNVSAEVRDLFQYIDRFTPTEMDLDTTLKCFIPEYIPAIGEMDAFIKVPRPDGKDDNLGLKFLDEPAATQSDPTVLELQLRAMSKKLQYGDVAVRSIENASKNPALVDKWIQSIATLHRAKPPPQVHFKRNMPDIDSLLDMWPPEFEKALESLQLPSPDLDLSLAEYAKTLCAILDIPTYENPIESLHLMFTLYMDFRNNPHFQQQMANINSKAEDKDGRGGGYQAIGGADVMEINQGGK